MGTDWEYYNPEPDDAREAAERGRIDFFREQPLEAESNWRLILVQLDDFGGPPPPDFYFERCRETLRCRGFSNAVVDEMERIVHEIVLPYNEQLLYPYLWPRDEILKPAIDWHFRNGAIDEVRRNELLEFARHLRHQSSR